jgi:hypothetical protein
MVSGQELHAWDYFPDLKYPTLSGFAIDGGGAARTAGIDMHAGQKTETLLTIATTSNRLSK